MVGIAKKVKRLSESYNSQMKSCKSYLDDEIDGRQYVVIASGGHQFFYRENLTDYILAYALPVNTSAEQ